MTQLLPGRAGSSFGWRTGQRAPVERIESPTCAAVAVSYVGCAE
jgi:hypothetical protein